MTRNTKENKVNVYVGSLETATVIKHCNAKRNLRYIGTDMNCVYNNKDVWAHVYEDPEGNCYAVIEDI